MIIKKNCFEHILGLNPSQQTSLNHLGAAMNSNCCFVLLNLITKIGKKIRIK